jgi:cytochrome c oxidase subunit II
MNTGASTFSQGVDLSLYIITGISLFFLIGITVVMIYFVIRYNKKRNPKATNIEGNFTLEVVWTVIPTLLVLLMFYYGWMGYKPMRQVPENAMEITAYGQMWKFSFEYPDGRITDTLVVPINQPVKLNLVARDVLHSFYVPAFRIKEDMVPGKNNFLWFEANREGRYDVLCAEYCGMLHSFMLSSITVVNQSAYDQWLTAAPIATDEHPGLAILKQNACLTCHSQDGSKLIGPSFKGVYGRTQIVDSNSETREIVVEDEYITRSIYNPNADIVQGYMRGLMISYENIISEEQIDDIIDYMKTLK